MNILREVKAKYLLNGTYFRMCKGATISIGKNVKIHNSRIIVTPNSTLKIGDNVSIENVVISVVNGEMIIGDYCILGGKKDNHLFNIESGAINIGHHSKISAARFWVRWGGIVSVGCYTNINSGSEIRCDKCVNIGDYNQISYNVRIWDTNTHTILSKEERRRTTEKYYPYYGYEEICPKTQKVEIGSDCWIGEDASILKGTTIEDEVIVGYKCLLSRQVIPTKSTVVSKAVLDIRRRN